MKTIQLSRGLGAALIGVALTVVANLTFAGLKKSAFAQQPASNTATAPADRKVKYYRNPMGLPDTSPAPKKDSMGMDYIPVYEGEDSDRGWSNCPPRKSSVPA